MGVDQALVAIGGRATRLLNSGLDVPISKAFLTVGGEPALYWALNSLRTAGISRLVICGTNSLQLHQAELVLDHLSNSFDKVVLFKDEGLGAHGLPYQVQAKLGEILDQTFIFECGHSIITPAHYRALIEAKRPGRPVFSLFAATPSNPRQPVSLDGKRVRLSQAGRYALAHPMVIDGEYVNQLPALGFNIAQILKFYISTDRIDFVPSSELPEFDTVEEFEAISNLSVQDIKTRIGYQP